MHNVTVNFMKLIKDMMQMQETYQMLIKSLFQRVSTLDQAAPAFWLFSKCYWVANKCTSTENVKIKL